MASWYGLAHFFNAGHNDEVGMFKRMQMKILLVLAPAVLTACTSTPLADGSTPPAQITYTAGACYGPCPAYIVTVREEGTGTWNGGTNVAVKGERQFHLSDAQYRAFATKLVPYRKDGTHEVIEGSQQCGIAATDHPTTAITWVDADGKQDKLVYYHGCHSPENRQMSEDLSAAAKELPLDEMIGPPAKLQP